MISKTLVQISDPHLSAKRAYSYLNWSATLTYIEKTNPDLVINTGDLVIDAPDDEEDLAFARSEMDRLTTQWRVLPGDHDIGGSPPDPWQGEYVTESRLNRFLQRYGEDRWATPFGDWYLIGLNSLIFDSGFSAEMTQWDFLEQQLRHANMRPTAIFMHKPPCVRSLDEDDSVKIAIPPVARRRFTALIRDTNVRLIGAGHLHEYRTFQSHGICIVVAPSTGFVSATEQSVANGIRRNGCVEYIFTGESVAFRMIEPEGVGFIHKGAISALTRNRDLPLLPVEAFSND